VLAIVITTTATGWHLNNRHDPARNDILIEIQKVEVIDIMDTTHHRVEVGLIETIGAEDDILKGQGRVEKVRDTNVIIREMIGGTINTTLEDDEDMIVQTIDPMDMIPDNSRHRGRGEKNLQGLEVVGDNFIRIDMVAAAVVEIEWVANY
jgi:hypothetical protein